MAPSPSPGIEPPVALARSARRIFSGVIGRSVILTPVARAIALPIAGATGGSPVSPIPWTSPSYRFSSDETPSRAGMSSGYAGR